MKEHPTIDSNGFAWAVCAILIFIVVYNIAFASGKSELPVDIEALFDGFFREYLALRPEFGTGLGLPSRLDIKTNNAELDDISDESEDRVYALYHKYIELLAGCDRSTLRDDQRVNYDVFKWFLENEIAGERFRYHQYIINPVLSFHNQLTSVLTGEHTIENEGDAEDYLHRLASYGTKIEQVINQIEVRQNKGIMPPIYTVKAFQQALDDFIADPAIENILYTSLVQRLDGVKSIKEKERVCLKETALQLINDVVYPSYRKLSGYIETLLDRANNDAGVWKLPDGDEFYAYCLKQHTTVDITPDEVHELGLLEVERIKKEINELYDELGIEQDISFAERQNQYWTILNEDEGNFFYPNNEFGRRRTIEGYQAIIDTMYEHLAQMFSLTPAAGVHVARVPAFKENTLGTHYDKPSLDGSKDGIFFVNLTYRHARPTMRTLTFHEAIPGHHLQIALAQESSTARLFRVLLHFSGYLEGWALYAEKLAGEYGMFPDIHNRIGYLNSELFRAVRLVVDTGLHRKKWTRDQVAQYMLEHVGWAGEGEINRYITWPGQACAYKIGELKILELRERARQELGNQFDIKEFHSVVLGHGSVPLEILERLVEEYIQGKKVN